MSNVALTAEYTFTFPKTYQHRTPVTTYETNYFNLGHYLRDNSRELYIALQVKPVKGLSLDISYLSAEKGNVVPYIYNASAPVDSDPFMDEVVWSADGRSAQYYMNTFNPGLFHGKNNTMVFGFQLGF